MFCFLVVHGVAGHVGGHQVRSELDAIEVQLQYSPEAAHQQRLAQAGHAFNKNVAAGNQCDQHFTDDLLLANQYLIEPAFNVVGQGGRIGEGGGLAHAVVLLRFN